MRWYLASTFVRVWDSIGFPGQLDLTTQLLMNILHATHLRFLMRFGNEQRMERMKMRMCIFSVAPLATVACSRASVHTH